MNNNIDPHFLVDPFDKPIDSTVVYPRLDTSFCDLLRKMVRDIVAEEIAKLPAQIRQQGGGQQ